ncbi:gamma-glutamylcyclotransferase family protein [Streptomyces sp. NPDC005483]|uniref:gamma-glutamylcyclotransferase family protein n=1 Tax=Streptomyces sp. NPDC005483 TaxID=3154882 RepID=UPI0033BA6473
MCGERIVSVTPARFPIFVYGTLRPGEVNHDLFLRGRIRSEEPGRLTGALLYDGPGYPYAVEEAGGVVMGELVTPRADAYAELLAVLDELEEYRPGDPRNLYERVAREVIRTADGTSVPAPSVAARLRTGGKPIEGGDWLLR